MDTILLSLALILLILGFCTTLLYSFDNLIYIIALSVFFIDWFSEELNIFPHQVTWSLEILIFILILVYLLPNIINGNIGKTPLIGLFSSIFLITIIGAIINKMNIIDFILGFRHFFKWPFFFIILMNSNFKSSTYNKLLLFILSLILVQPFIAIIQHYIFGATDDTIFGSVRSNGLLSIIFIWYFLITTKGLEKKTITKYKIPLFVSYFLMVFVCAISEAKAFFALLPIIMVYSFSDILLKLRFSGILFIAAINLLVFYGFNVMTSTHDFNLGEIKSLNIGPEVILSVMESEESSALKVEELGRSDQNYTFLRSMATRFSSLYSAFKFVFSDIKTFIFGSGLGSFTLKYGEQWWLIDSPNRYVYYLPFSQMIGSIGVICFVIYLFIIYKITKFVKIISRYEMDKLLKTLFLSISPISIIYLGTLFYSDHFHDVIGFTYWSFIAIAYSRNRFNIMENKIS